MNRDTDHAPGRMLAGWIGAVHRGAGWVVAAALAASAMALWFTASNLGINTDTTDMIDETLPFRQAVKDYDRAFPLSIDTLVVVIDGETPDLAEDAATRLAERLRRDDAIFKTVYHPGGEAFFTTNGLLYLDTEALGDLADNLAKVQPLIGKLSRDPSLRGLFGVLQSALEEAGPETNTESFDLTAAFDRLDKATGAALENRPYHLSWRSVISGDDEADINDRRAYLVVQPILDFTSVQPQKLSLDRMRSVIDELGLSAAQGVRVRLTGSVALNYAQLESARDGAELAGPLSFLLVGVILLMGLRSLRLVFSALITLLCGLIWTAGFATAAIGELNLISIAFAVLFISLGAAFSIHMCLRYQELIGLGHGQKEAVANAGREVGGALFLCAATTAAGFYVFIPTDYTGVSELGLIAGTGMFICLFANFTVLPAMLGVLPLTKVTRTASRPAGKEILPRHRGAVRIGAVIVALAAIPPVIAARFDFNPLNLHDPTAESVTTLQDLLKDSERPPWSIDVLTGGVEEADAMAQRIDGLEGVYQALSIADYLPGDQAEKLALIEEMALFMGPPVRDPMAPPDAAQRRDALDSFMAALDRYAGPGAEPLSENLTRLLAQDDVAALLEIIESSLLGGFSERIRRLYAALEPVEPITFNDLPQSLLMREIAKDGRVRVQVFPEDDMTDNAALRRFVATVRSVAPDAVGSPISLLESGDAVVDAFIQALVSAVAAVVVLVIILMRRLDDVIFVVAPLLLAALLTIASSTLFNLPFNFANVIVLPVLFGVGVDSAIHLVYRYRTDPKSRASILSTSTARGVVFSALTTIAGFGSLAVSTHRGTATMGILLTIGVILTLICTLLVLPALLPRASK